MLSALSPRDPRFWRVPAGASRRLARAVLTTLLAIGVAGVAHAQRVAPVEFVGADVGVMVGVVCARLSDAGETTTRKANANVTHAKEMDDARSSLPIMS